MDTKSIVAHNTGSEVAELVNEGVNIVCGSNGHVFPSREKMMMSEGFGRGIGELVEFIGGEAFKDTGGVWTGFNVFKEKKIKIKRGGPSIGMGVMKEVGKGNVAGRGTGGRTDKGAREGRGSTGLTENVARKLIRRSAWSGIRGATRGGISHKRGGGSSGGGLGKRRSGGGNRGRG